MFYVIAKITGRSIGFLDEIRAEKWVNFGLEIAVLPRVMTENLSYYFSDPDMTLIQLLFSLTTQPLLLMKAFLEGYSIDGHVNSTLTGLKYNPEEYALDCNENEHKEISNMKYFLYFINSLMVNDRNLLFQWRPYNEFQIHATDKNVNGRIQKCLEKTAKYEAIHTLVRMSGSGIKAIFDKTSKQLSESQEFEKELNKYAKITTSREGKKLFNIDPKYMSYFDSFYYKNLNSHAEAMKVYEEFYKPQDKDANKDKAKETQSIENFKL